MELTILAWSGLSVCAPNPVHRSADPVTVSDTHLCVWQAIDSEVLAELSVSEAGSTQLVLPISMGIVLIDQYGPVFAAMARQVSLSVAVYVETAYHARAFNRRLPNASIDRLALPGDVAR
jgi:hypothetical protein